VLLGRFASRTEAESRRREEAPIVCRLAVVEVVEPPTPEPGVVEGPSGLRYRVIDGVLEYACAEFPEEWFAEKFIQANDAADEDVHALLRQVAR
jgi:hypothetical protein